jgi:PIN domain nuclease of toxin-antitoxin system
VRLLLDTHVVLWALLVPSRLSRQAAELLQRADSELLVSPASAWEIATKQRLGKLPHAAPIVAAYVAHLAALRAEELPIRSVHAIRAGSFAVDHRDPFDRMLAAQSSLEGIPLLTNDVAFRLFPDVEAIW